MTIRIAQLSKKLKDKDSPQRKLEQLSGGKSWVQVSGSLRVVHGDLERGIGNVTENTNDTPKGGVILPVPS